MSENSNSVKVERWAVEERLKAFSRIIEDPDSCTRFNSGNCWWSISSPSSKSRIEIVHPITKERLMIITVAEQIGCSEADMVNTFKTIGQRH